MTTSAIEVIEAVYAARRRRDIEAVLALCAEALVFTVNVDPDKPGSGTTLVGKVQNRRHLELTDGLWEPVQTTIGPLRVVANAFDAGEDVPPATMIRVTIRFSLRQKASGQILEGTKTHEWKVRDGKVVSLCETLDREFIHAFMRMAAMPPAPNEPSKADKTDDVPAPQIGRTQP